MKKRLLFGARGCGKSIRLNYYLLKRCLPWFLRPFFTYRYYLKHYVYYTEVVD